MTIRDRGRNIPIIRTPATPMPNLVMDPVVAQECLQLQTVWRCIGHKFGARELEQVNDVLLPVGLDQRHLGMPKTTGAPFLASPKVVQVLDGKGQEDGQHRTEQKAERN